MAKYKDLILACEMINVDWAVLPPSLCRLDHMAHSVVESGKSRPAGDVGY